MRANTRSAAIVAVALASGCASTTAPRCDDAQDAAVILRLEKVGHGTADDVVALLSARTFDEPEARARLARLHPGAKVALGEVSATRAPDLTDGPVAQLKVAIESAHEESDGIVLAQMICGRRTWVVAPPPSEEREGPRPENAFVVCLADALFRRGLDWTVRVLATTKPPDGSDARRAWVDERADSYSRAFAGLLPAR